MDPIEIASDLIRLNTVNPPGDEEAAARYVAELLERNDFTVERHDFNPGRPSLVAGFHGTDADVAPLVFTGHLDTVPLGANRGHLTRLAKFATADFTDEGPPTRKPPWPR
jgi:succinyl-diaminopimelate desuccinylase